MQRPIHHGTTPYLQQGIVLLEGLVAILIFSIGILGVIALQANLVKNEGEARFRAVANNVAQQRIGTLWLDQANLAAYVEESTDISAVSGLPNGRRTTIRGGANCDNDLSCFIIRVSWLQPGSNETHTVTDIARITGGV